MDTSEQRIKMCEKAEEIQAHKPDSSQGEFVYCEGEAYQEADDRPLTPFIWLPRQDQLQDIILDKDDPHALDNLITSFCNWFMYYGGMLGQEKEEHFTSMDQLWLAFVMQEEYGKVWNGEEWLLA